MSGVRPRLPSSEGQRKDAGQQEAVPSNSFQVSSVVASVEAIGHADSGCFRREIGLPRGAQRAEEFRQHVRGLEVDAVASASDGLQVETLIVREPDVLNRAQVPPSRIRHAAEREGFGAGAYLIEVRPDRYSH